MLQVQRANSRMSWNAAGCLLNASGLGGKPGQDLEHCLSAPREVLAYSQRQGSISVAGSLLSRTLGTTQRAWTLTGSEHSLMLAARQGAQANGD